MLLQTAVLVASTKQADVPETFGIAVVRNVILLPTEIVWLLLINLLVLMMVLVNYYISLQMSYCI